MTRETWWIAGGQDGDVRRNLDARALDSITGVMAAAAAGEVLSTDRNSAVIRLAGAPPLLVKWRRPRAGRGRRTYLRASRERREARALIKLARLGIEAPTVWAVGERRRRGLLLGSCLIRPWIDARVTASSMLLDKGDEAVADDLARTIRRWHEAGFRHGDCYPKNVLVDPDTREAVPIGCPAARFVRPGPGGGRARWKDLAQWTVGLDLLHAEGAARRFAAAYLGAAPGLGDERALAARLEAPRARILRRKAERLATQPEREPEGPPPPTPLPPTPDPGARRIRPLAALVPSRR